jgi:sulfur carrier protein
MKISVKQGKKTEIVNLGQNATINDLLEQLGINRETVLVRRNGKITIEEEILREGDSVEIIQAISGG